MQHGADVKVTYLHLASVYKFTLKSSCENVAI